MTAVLRHERVLAVDPGKLTGMALLERVRTADSHTVALLRSAEAGPGDVIPLFREWYREFCAPAEPGQPPIRVVVESFKITVETGKKSQEASWALRTTGAVEQACRDLGYSPDAIAYFKPDQKSAFPNPSLKKLGLWHRGGEGHALDAIRHGLLYLRQSGLLPETF